MRLTPVLYVRHLLAKLHPPLLKTPRESQQLLNILESSFRKHLDDTHPSPAQRQPSSASPSDIPLASLDSSSNATNNYFSTVLNNPLLARQSAQEKIALSENALDLFRRASLEGNVSIPFLRRCAAEHLQGLKRRSRVVGSEKLIPKIAAWLYTAPPTSRESFMASTELLNLVVQIAGLEQEEGIAWDWLRRVYERNFGSDLHTKNSEPMDPKWLTVEDSLVSCIMRLSLLRGDANDAAQQFVEACAYRLDSGRAAPRPADATDGLKYIPMEYSWKRLAASIIFYRGRHGIDANVFDRAMTCSLPWSSAPHFSEPIMLVYHPVAPSAVSLHHNLKDSELAGQFLSTQAGLSRKHRRTMLLAILDGAQVSLDQGHRHHAQFLLDFANIHFAEFLSALAQKSQPSLDAAIKTAHDELGAPSYNFAWT